jgi:hypothetical protein
MIELDGFTIEAAASLVHPPGARAPAHGRPRALGAHSAAPRAPYGSVSRARTSNRYWVHLPRLGALLETPARPPATAPKSGASTLPRSRQTANPQLTRLGARGFPSSPPSSALPSRGLASVARADNDDGMIDPEPWVTRAHRGPRSTRLPLSQEYREAVEAAIRPATAEKRIVFARHGAARDGGRLEHSRHGQSAVRQ